MADNLAAQLPSEIAYHLRIDYPFERMHVNEFFARVREREGGSVDLPAAVYHARVVLDVLREAVSPGIIAKVRQELPAEFDPLFESGSRGRMESPREGRPNR